MKYLILFTCLSLHKITIAQTDSLFYSFVKGNKTRGIQKIWMNNPTEYGFFLQYNDRGRGDIRRVEWVVKNNKMYYPKQLLESIGWSYY